MNGPRKSGTSVVDRRHGDTQIVGIASLDSPLLQQSKSEIRSLAAEIAQLANSTIEPAEFYHGFLNRLVTAMGATAGAIWQCDHRASPEIKLVAEQQLPEILKNDAQLYAKHDAILRSVLTEEQPMLIPPGNVSLESQRPSNPLDKALIVVPVRVQAAIEFMVEVVQRPTGGPAAQRGYLRFVAQMSDLLADFLRHYRLRELTTHQKSVELLEASLHDLAQAQSRGGRQQVASNVLQRLTCSEHAVLIAHQSNFRQRSRVVAIAGTGAFDPRSKLVINIAEFIHRWAATQPECPITVFDAPELTLPSQTHPLEHDLGSEVAELCRQLGGQRLVALRLGTGGLFSAMLSFSHADIALEEQLKSSRSSLERMAKSVGMLLEAQLQPSPLFRRLGRHGAQANVSLTPTIQRRTRLLSRLVIATILGSAALVPIPQKISAVGILKPSSKQNYYSPAPATVEQVWVQEGEEVCEGQPLVTLTSTELNFQLLRLQAEVIQYAEMVDNLKITIGKSNRLTPNELADAEFRLHSYERELSALEAELKVREAEIEKLTIRARQAGRVSSWGLEDRLRGRPVVADDLLLSTIEHDQDWHFEISVPEHRVGLVSQSMDDVRGSVPVSLVLSSFPDQVLNGELRRLGAQTSTTELSLRSNKSERSVFARVFVNADSLPLRKDGAFASASIDCGRVPLVWMVIRDAYCHISSRIQMLW